MKLNRILKELAETKDLLLEKYLVIEDLKQMNENLRELNANLSKKVKDLQTHSTIIEKNNKMLRENVKRKTTISEV